MTAYCLRSDQIYFISEERNELFSQNLNVEYIHVTNSFMDIIMCMINVEVCSN